MTDAEFKRFQKLLGDRIYNRRSVRSRGKDVELSLFARRLRAIAPSTWSVEQRGRAFRLLGPEVEEDAERASILLWFADVSIASSDLRKRDKSLPKIGALNNTQLGRHYFIRNRAALPGWPEFGLDIRRIELVDHIALAGLNPTRNIDWTNAAYVRDVQIGRNGQRETILSNIGPPDFGITSLTKFLVFGELPDPARTANDLNREIAERHLDTFSKLCAEARKHSVPIISAKEFQIYTKMRLQKGHGFHTRWITDPNKIQPPECLLTGNGLVLVPVDKPEPDTEAGNAGTHKTGDSEESRTVGEPTQPTFKLQQSGRRFTSVGFSDDSSSLLTFSTNGKDGRIHTWNIATRKETNALPLDDSPESRLISGAGIVMSTDRTRIARIIDGQIKIWDTKTGVLLQTLAPSKEQQVSQIQGLSASADFSRIACGHRNAPMRAGLVDPNANPIVWDSSTGDVIQVIKDEIAVHSTALSPDGKWLATTNWGARFAVYDVLTGRKRYTVRNDNSDRKHPDPKVSGHSANMVLEVSFSPDGKTIAAGDLLGVKLYDAATGKLKKRLPLPFRYNSGRLVFSPDGQMLARIGTDKTVPIWSTQSGELLAELSTESWAGSFSPDGQWFAVGRSDKTHGIALWRLPENSADQTQLRQ